MRLWATIMSLPFLLGKGRRYFEWQAATGLLTVFVALVWLAAPFAVWKAFGMAWVLAWLLPTAITVCAFGAARSFEGGG
ncbi:MAG: hypothetical protein U0S12_06630 [Fimbriimonadales bacterium]